MLTIDLIRHAESKWVVEANSSLIKRFGGRMVEVDLSPDGDQQAAALGRYALARHLRPDFVVCSPAVRAVRTYEGCAKVMGLTLEPTLDDRLLERDWGDWTGGPRSVLDDPAIRRAMEEQGDDFTPPGGESITTVRKRVTEAVLAFADVNPDGTCWMFMHRNGIHNLVSPLLSESERPIMPDLVSRTTIIPANNQINLVAYNQPTLADETQ